MNNEEKDKDKKDVPNEPEKINEAPAEPKQTESESEKTPSSDTSESKSLESVPKPEPTPETVSDTSGMEALRAENIRLKAQIEAYKTGFRSETLEDAVLLAENIAKRDGVKISEALQAIAEKYPDWKNTENNSGFKVGAESPEENKPDESRLDNAFGIRKKKGM